MEYAIVPYSYASPFTDTLRLPERLFELGFGAPVTIKQAYKPDGLGGSKLGFGASVYDAAFVLSNFIARFRSYVEGKTVVEVGAGLGLASIACAMSGACHTVATDGDDDLLLLARENMVANAPTLVHAGKLRTHTLMCDAFPQLCDTLTSLFNECGADTAIIAYKRRFHTEDTFFELIGKHFTIRDVDRSDIHPDFAGDARMRLIILTQRTEE